MESPLTVPPAITRVSQLPDQSQCPGPCTVLVASAWFFVPSPSQETCSEYGLQVKTREKQHERLRRCCLLQRVRCGRIGTVGTSGGDRWTMHVLVSLHDAPFHVFVGLFRLFPVYFVNFS